MSEGVWGRPESPHNQPMIHQSIKNNVVYYKIKNGKWKVESGDFLLEYFLNTG